MRTDLHSIGDAITHARSDGSSVTVTVRSLQSHVEESSPADEPLDTRHDLHALRVVVEHTGAHPLDGALDHALIQTTHGRWVEADALMVLDGLLPDERVEDTLVFFLRPGEEPDVLRYIDRGGNRSEWLLK